MPRLLRSGIRPVGTGCFARSAALCILFAGLALAANSSTADAQPEVTGTWQGRVEALVVDNLAAGTSRTRLFLHTSQETLELNMEGNAALRAGQVVKVTGRASGKRLIASQTLILPQDSTADACTTTGEQKTVVILASFPSKALLSSVTPALMRNSFLGPGRSLDAFLRESSFGQTWAAVDVLGPFVLDADYFDEPLAARDAALRAAAPSADLARYTRIFVVAPQGEMGMDSGGMALLGCGQIASPQGNLYASSMWLGAESMVTQNDVVDTATHELGHGFGLEHARLADYGNDSLGPAGQAAAPWDQLHEYGDTFSNMGRQSAQWAAPQKALLGWLQPGVNIQTVTADGTYTLAPYESAGGGQVLRVSRGTSGEDWLWLEYRQPQGTSDTTLPAAAFAGVLAHYADPALTATVADAGPNTYTNLMNFHPAVTLGADPALHSGETWHDPYGSLSLTAGPATAAGLSVSVSFAPAPVCASAVGAVQTFDAAGGIATVPVTAPGACSWSAVASASWIGLGSSRAGTGNGALSLTVAPNTDVSPRWGKITVGDAFVVITQAGGSAWMTVSPQAASIPAAGGAGQISAATSAPDLEWSMGWDASWITDVECSCYQTVGPATIRYIVAANHGAERRATIMVGGQAFTVTQQSGMTERRGPVGSGKPTFSQVAPPDAPPSRLNMALASFGRSGQAILYGGNWNTDVFADTWLWNGTNWTALQPAHNPGMLSQHAMVYDEARGQIVLFGGLVSAAPVPSAATWIWDGNDWHRMQPAMSPPARFGHAMAYDSVSRKVVLFGGYGSFGETNDTWTWDGANWTQAITPESPMARAGHSMAFDAARGETLLFGGFSSQGTATWFSDTWAWEGSTWRQKFTATPPAARSGHVLAYHAGLGEVVMIGGAGGKDVTETTWNYDFRKETWAWNGEEWVQQFPENQPGAAYSIGAVWDGSKRALTVQLGDDLTCASRGPKTFLLKGSGAVQFR